MMRQNFLFSVVCYDCSSGYPSHTRINVQYQMSQDKHLQYLLAEISQCNCHSEHIYSVFSIPPSSISFPFPLALWCVWNGNVRSIFFGTCPFHVLCYLSLFQDKLLRPRSSSPCDSFSVPVLLLLSSFSAGCSIPEEARLEWIAHHPPLIPRAS